MGNLRFTYSVKDMCAALGVSRTTLYWLVRKGRLKPLKLGIRRVLFSHEELMRFLGGRK
jgi:excisionase family DNA binding protein